LEREREGTTRKRGVGKSGCRLPVQLMVRKEREREGERERERIEVDSDEGGDATITGDQENSLVAFD
jgi:hypothetical protein